MSAFVFIVAQLFLSCWIYICCGVIMLGMPREW